MTHDNRLFLDFEPLSAVTILTVCFPCLALVLACPPNYREF